MELLNIVNVLLCLVTGIFSGLAAGLMGVGGGLVNVPALYFVFQQAGYPKEQCFHLALGTSLTIIILTSLSAAKTHYTKGNLILRVSLICGFMGIAGSFAASLTAVNLSDSLLKKAFAVMLIVAGIQMLTKKNPPNPSESEMNLETWRLGIIGLGSGILAGFFGIGGGLIGVPLFVLWSKMGQHKAVGSSSGMVIILAVFGALGYALSKPPIPMDYSFGYINFPACLMVAATSIVFASIGARLAAKVNARVLTIIFVCVAGLIALKMIIS